MKRTIVDNLKNIGGWTTDQKLVVISVDDYGGVRLGSKQAKDRLCSSGIALEGHFDQFDTLETRQDLDALFEVLSGVKDGLGNTAVVTAYALSANPDFVALRKGSQTYRYEGLVKTFDRLSVEQPDSYDGAWALWLEGIRNGYLVPQFHGREHLNVSLFEKKLRARDPVLVANIESSSLAGIGGDISTPGVSITHALQPLQQRDVDAHKEIIADGLALFESTFGMSSKTFTPPAHKLDPVLYRSIEDAGIQGIDKPLVIRQRKDSQLKLRKLNRTGIQDGEGHVTLVRNVVFEPSRTRSADTVKLALGQVAAAFRWRKPAILSSHRVNYCGLIDPENRRHGLEEFRRLLRQIVRRWPDAQFISAADLVSKIGGY